MTRNLGFKTVGLIWFGVAGCAPELATNPPGEAFSQASAREELPPPRPAPTCELSSTDASSATIVCRDVEPQSVDVAPPPLAFAPAPPPLRQEQVVTFPRPEDSSADDLAPDPFAAPLRETRLRAGPPLAQDDLAPDPFARPRRATRLRASPPLAQDDLAPDPFARPRRQARPNGKPLSDDDLAPDPF